MSNLKNPAIYALCLLLGFYTGYRESSSVIKYYDSKNWVATPAEVVSSEVKQSTGRKRSSKSAYSTVIKYQYLFNNKKYISDKLYVVDFSSTEYEDKVKLAKEYPVGRKLTCYVNPNDPRNAVIDRNPGWQIWIAAYPLVLIIIGLGGLFITLRKREKS